MRLSPISFFFNDTATTEIYTLSLHDALPISISEAAIAGSGVGAAIVGCRPVVELQISDFGPAADRKSTRLNSSHVRISYAVFCLKKKKIKNTHTKTAPSTRTDTLCTFTTRRV